MPFQNSTFDVFKISLIFYKNIRQGPDMKPGYPDPYDLDMVVVKTFPAHISSMWQ